MRKPKALVLCGGKGTRLRPITYYLQKTMIPIGYTQNPLLEYIVRLLRFYGFDEMAFLVDYRVEQIRNYFSDGERFNVKIRYVPDSEQLKGTGGSVINAFKQGAFDEENTALIYYGDIVSNFNLKRLLDFHSEKRAHVTVALASKFEVRVGVADIAADGKIRGFIEKPRLEKPVSVGIVALEGESVKLAEELAKNSQTIDLMGDIIPRLIESGKSVYGFVSDAFWYDIGSIEAYEKLENDKVRDAMSFLF